MCRDRVFARVPSGYPTHVALPRSIEPSLGPCTFGVNEDLQSSKFFCYAQSSVEGQP